jgi:hypothetical protein
LIRVIVISHNQRESLEEMTFSLRAQLPGYQRLFVLDRCVDDSAALLTSLGEAFVEKNEGTGWEAGQVRNKGLKHFGYSGNFLVLDGDRIPSGLSPLGIDEALSKYDFTLLSLSKDTRTWFDRGTPGVLVDNPHMGLLNNSFMTPGILIRDTALRKCVKENDGFLFNPRMDGVWGFEDFALGDLVSSLELTCGGFPTTVWLSGGFDTVEDLEASKKKIETRADIARGIYLNKKGNLTQWWK